MALKSAEIPKTEEKRQEEPPCPANNKSVDESSSRDETGNADMSGKGMEYPEGGARAWFDAIGAAGALFCTSGYINAFGVYQDYYFTHQLHNYSPSAIAWIGSIQMLFLFGASLLGGPLFDRHGSKVIWPPAIVLVFSVMMTSLCKEYYQFMLAQGVLGGLSMGMTMAPALASTGQYFNKNRGAAMGIAIAGSSLGGVIFPIALSRMLSNPRLGFGWTVRICGFIILTVLSFSCLCIRARLPPRKDNFLKLAAFKKLSYTSLTAAAFLMLLGIFTPFFYLPIYATQHGMSLQRAYYMVALLNGTSTFGRLLPGVLADRMGPLNTLFIFGNISGILLICWQKMTSHAAITAFSAVYGFFSGSILSLLSVSLAHMADNPQDIGTYLGMGMFVISFSSLVGPPINGALLTNYHGFLQVQIFSGVVVIAGSLLLVITKISWKGLFHKS